MRLPRLWRDVMPHHMEDIMEHSGQIPRSSKVAFSSQRVWRYKGVCQETPLMSKIGEHQLTRCNASHEQSPSRTLWCVGNWFHRAVPQVQELWVHLGGRGLCVQMGRSTPCRISNSKHAKRMFHEVIFPHFGTPQMVISDEGSHFIDKVF
jgi:hypothetical protein